jgi:arginyl-tRNA synthetase
MGLFGRLKGKEGAPKSPQAVAQALVQALPPNALVAETSLAGPGFINIKLSRPYIAQRISTMLQQGIASWAPKLAVRRAVVDFSSPNVAKEMHVGHLRSTIIGDTLCRTLEFCGVDTLRLNHIGDWGTQFGMLIQHMAETRPQGMGGSEGGPAEDVSDLMQLYRAAKKRFDEDEEFKVRAREAVTRLQSGEATRGEGAGVGRQGGRAFREGPRASGLLPIQRFSPSFSPCPGRSSGDKASLDAWSSICAASRKEFQALYDRMGVVATERGESFYNPMLKEVVEELTRQGVAEISEGAACIFVEGVKVPLIIQKSDGGYG